MAIQHDTFTCAHCGSLFRVRTSYVRHRALRGRPLPIYCGRACTGAAQTLRVTRDNILDLSLPEPNSGCWLWLGSIIPTTGYGRIGLRSEPAHRASFEAHGGAIPAGLVLRHRCDNPACVNPDHLEPGTHADNVADCVRRGRNARGSRNRHAVLDEEQVAAARARLAAGASQAAEARRLGVSHGIVHRIANDRTWKHVAANDAAAAGKVA